MTKRALRKGSRISGLFILAILLTSVTVSSVLAQNYDFVINPFDAGTPAESKGGMAGIASYAPDKVETVNLTNNILNLYLPLATVGGRGSASFTIALKYNSNLWAGQNHVEMVQDSFDQEIFVKVNHFKTSFDDATMRTPNQIVLGSGWAILKAPAIKTERVDIDPITCPNVREYPYHSFVLTKVWIVLPDGSEVELRDAATNGAPYKILNGCSNPNRSDTNRGKVWKSADGSAITYITNDANGVTNGLLEGTVFLADGTRLIMSATQSGGSSRCKKIIDPNGNVLDIGYDSPVAGAVTYVDQLGRQVTLQKVVLAGGVEEVRVTIKGYDGAADRTITINTGELADTDAGSNPINLIQEDQGVIFPIISGDYNTDTQGHLDPQAHTDLFWNQVLEVGSDEFGGYVDMDVAKVVTQLNLLDGRKFKFKYNRYGELAEVTYPAGGVSKIDYQNFGSGNCDGSGILTPMLGRGVSQRRLYDDGTTLSATWNYTRGTGTIGGTTYPTRTVETRQGGTNALLMSEKHYFLTINDEYRSCSQLQGSNGTRNEKWENNKAIRAERITGTGTQIEVKEWAQRANVTWIGGQDYISAHPSTGQENPPNDTRVTREDSILENGKMKRMTYGYDEFNNVTSAVEHDFGPNSTTPGTILRRINRTYATVINNRCYTGLNGTTSSCSTTPAADHNDIIHMRRLLLSESVLNTGSQEEARAELEYDRYVDDGNNAAIFTNSGMSAYNGARFGSFPAASQPRGNITKMRRWIVGTTWAESYGQYDNAGNVIKTKDPLGRVTSISYVDNFGSGIDPDTPTFFPAEPTFAFATKVTNQLQHEVKSQYHYGRGAPTGLKDANGVKTRTEYNDPYDRPTRVIAGVGLTGSVNVVTEMSYPTLSSNEMKTSKQFDDTKWLSSRVQYDGFGRPLIASQSEDGLHFNSANFTIHSKAIYDGLGRIVKATNPYRSAPAPTDGWTRTTYDIAGRVTEAATSSGSPSTPPPDIGLPPNWTGSVLTTYASEVTTVRDQAGKQRRSTVDGLGRLKMVEELNEAPATSVYATTSYTYDARGNLKTVTQGVQGRSFNYDGLSRLTRAENPESGVINYGYDAASNLTSKQDARGIITSYEYDLINRLKKKTYTGGTPATPVVDYLYDSPSVANSKGRLTSVSNTVSTYSYTNYDALGRVVEYNQQTSGNLYTMSAVYNKAGMMTSETYPSGKVLETHYDGAGRVAGVKQAGASGFFAGAGSSDATNRLQYTPHGAVSAMRLGNGLWEHANFNSRLQPTQIGLGTTSTTSGVLQLDYGYGASSSNNGNITSQTITAPTTAGPNLVLTQSYSYDQVNRLLTASEGANWTQTYDYDQYGNRAVRVGSYIPNPPLTPTSTSSTDFSAFNSSNNRIVSSGYDYDPSGNLEGDPTTGLNAILYDGENRMVSHTKSGVTTSYVYDGDGRRVSKSDATGTLIFVYNEAGQLIAEYSTASQTGTLQTSYMTTDHLGSTRVVTDQNQAVKARHDYLPFGEEMGSEKGGRRGVSGYTAVDSTRQRFTGHESDNESGLDYAKARCHSGMQGRFLSCDPYNELRLRVARCANKTPCATSARVCCWLKACQ